MSDTATQGDEASRQGTSPWPYPSSVGGVLFWICFAAALQGYICFDVYQNGKEFKVLAKQRANREARATIARLRTAEAAYLAKNGVYLATTSRGENDFYPAPGPEPRRRRFQPRLDKRASWELLASAMPKKRLYCGYTIVAGPAGSLDKAGPRGKALFGNAPPSTPWYYIRARCIQGGGKVLVFESTSASDRVVFSQ